MMSSWMDSVRSWLKPAAPRTESRSRRSRLQAEILEAREVPAITVGGPAPICGPLPAWQPVGPVNGIQTGNLNLTNPPDIQTGAINSAVVDPFHPTRMAVSTVNGGVWLTN